ARDDVDGLLRCAGPAGWDHPRPGPDGPETGGRTHGLVPDPDRSPYREVPAIAGGEVPAHHSPAGIPAPGRPDLRDARLHPPPPAARASTPLGGQLCAMPGCPRPTSCNCEGDPIDAFHLALPRLGGRTCILNMHMLCWTHPRLNTLGLLHATRTPATNPQPPS